ncbi:MAG: tRNA pseudouridine(38-40) synthase TruA [Alphaproteobacteria bacterium]|nr:MAG: tRNA pseudouridine(38-40) synthase TruA [Alphaproteobacteria bacterium]
MTRYKAIIEYDGTHFYGFQRQSSKKETVQAFLETALQKLTKETITLAAAGRTDAGVHAKGQVIHFDLSKEWDPYDLRSGLNFYLEYVSVLSVEKVSENFHARFTAKERWYEYHIINRPAKLSLDKYRAWHVFYPLDIQKLHEGAKFFIGVHDFSAFQSASSLEEMPEIRIERAIDVFDVQSNNDHIVCTIKARSFLHNQVRMMMGSLAWYAAERISKDVIQTALEKGVKQGLGPTAPPHGLYFMGVKY